MLCFQFFQRRLLKQTEHQGPRRAPLKIPIRWGLPLWICIEDKSNEPALSPLP